MPVCLVLMALPLLIPWNVVGTIWQVFGARRHRPARLDVNQLGIDYNYVADPFDAWVTIIVMDVWHWTCLVVLLCYAGLNSIPDAFYQAAKIDGASRWAVFRYIQLPKMKRVLVIAVLLRFMDSFMIYTEPFVVTGGGPGNSTTFLSIDLVKLALGQFDLGKAAAMSLVYNLIILVVCWVFYTVMTNRRKRSRRKGCHRLGRDAAPASVDRAGAPGERLICWSSTSVLLCPIYWLVNMSLKTNTEITSALTLIPLAPTSPTTSDDLHRSDPGHWATSTP